MDKGIEKTTELKKPKNSILFILIPLLIWFFAAFILDFNGLYGQDAHEYFRYSLALKNQILEGIPSGIFHWPIFYPLAGALIQIVIPYSEVMQLISLLALIGSTLALTKLLNHFYSDEKDSIAGVVFLVFTASPFILRAGIIGMSDMLGSFFSLIALLNLLRYARQIQTKQLVLGFLFTAIAFYTRYPSIIILLIPLLFCSKIALQNSDVKGIVSGCILVALVSLPHLLLRQENSLHFLHHEGLHKWSVNAFIKNNFNTADGHLSYTLPNIIYAFSNLFHPGFFILFLPSILFIKKLRFYTIEHKIIFSSFLLYTLFIAGFDSQNNRFLLMSFPLMVIMLFPLLKALYTSLGKFKRVFVLTLLSIQLSLFIFSIQPIYQRNQLEQEIALKMKSYQKSKVYSFDIDVALKNYLPEFEWVNLWEKKYEKFDHGDLVLFNPKKFEIQWRDKNPMINWKKLSSSHHLKKLESFRAGWNLYEIR